MKSETDRRRLEVEQCKTRADAVTLYAAALQRVSFDDAEFWVSLNQAIVARWSTHALSWIKERAWRSVRGEEFRIPPVPQSGEMKEEK